MKHIEIDHEMTLSVSTYEVDFNRVLKMSSLFNYLQEISAKHTDDTTLGRDYLLSHNVFWALARYKIKIAYMPVMNDEITVRTCPKGHDKMFAYRDYEVRKDGELIAVGTSDWILMDIDTRRPLRISELAKIGTVFPEIREEPVCERPGKIITSGSAIKRYTKTVSYNDIDLYGHVNNVRYLEWAMETFSVKEMRQQYIDSIQLNFIAEAKDEDEVEITRYQVDESNFVIEGINKETDSKTFQMTASMKKV